MPKCRADIYLLADNTGSMGGIVEAVQQAGLDILEALSAVPGVDLTFGVGNYQDFPTEQLGILYGDKFHRPNAITVPAGGTVTIPFAPGPDTQGGRSWPGAVSATYSSPVTSITIPSTGIYNITTRILAEFVGSSTDDLTARVVSNLQGIISGSTEDLLASPVSIETGLAEHYTTGEVIHVEVVNNGAFDVEIRWDSELRAYHIADDFTNIHGNPYCFLHQLDLTTDHDAVAAAFYNWRADAGADYPEGWLYALDQLCEQTFWRENSVRFIVDLGDAPPHDPICAAISGLDYDITEDSVTTKLVEGNFVYIGVSHSDPGEGLNDTDPGHNYDAYCGPGTIASGHADRIALATNGFVQYFEDNVDVVDALLDVLAAALDDCHNARRILPWVGSIS